MVVTGPLTYLDNACDVRSQLSSEGQWNVPLNP